MKALVYTGERSLSYQDATDPVCREGEQLVKVMASGICGSDMHAYLGHDERRPAPLILGHEAAGIIEEGPDAGRRVTINPLVTCLDCPACKAGRENLCPSRQIISMPPREGAFAQYVSLPTQNLVFVPDHVRFEQAALCEPLAVSWHTARLALKALDTSMPQNALIIGGGAIGLAAALALRAMGINDVVISEPNDERRMFLEEVCGQQVTNAPRADNSIVIDAVGYGPTRAIASELVSPGGVIAHVGLGDSSPGLDIRRITLQEITVIGTYTYTAQDFRDTAQAIFDGRLGDLSWIEQRPLSEGAVAFDDLRAGRVASPKIVLNPWA